MIPDKTTMKSCVGKYATLDRDIKNGAGHGMGKGCKVKIVASNGRGMVIRTEKCPCCQQFSEISHVQREALTLIGEGTERFGENGMNIGQAVAIFQNIYKSDIEDKEKFEAIKTVLNMETHNGITKQEFINALDYVMNYIGK